MSNRNFTSRRAKRRGRHLKPDHRRRSPARRPDRSGGLRSSGVSSGISSPTPVDGSSAYDLLATEILDTSGQPVGRVSTRSSASASAGTGEVKDAATSATPRPSNHSPPLSPLQPGSSHSLRQMDTRRYRSGMWTTLGLVMLAAALTVLLLRFVGGADQSHTEARSAVLSAAEVAAEAVDAGNSVLQSLRAESTFTPELVADTSALGDASRALVESVAVLPTDEPSLAELRIQATGLAGRVSRLGETFGAAFSYRGQIGPLLTIPALTEPTNISNLPHNTNLLTDWQFRLEQAASTRPSHPRLEQNREALEAILPYIDVHRQAYVDAVGASQEQQATIALSQLSSLVSALRQDFNRAYAEITEMAEAEIRSLTAEFQVLVNGTSST